VNGFVPSRKPNRLQGYDYTRQGAYFVTVCAQNRAELFGRIDCVNECTKSPATELSKIGCVVKRAIEMLSEIYPSVHVDQFVIMPNHIHMIIVIDDEQKPCRGELRSPAQDSPNVSSNNGRTQFAPTLSRIIKQWKGVITKQLGFSPWQKSFHDHVIRNQDDYLRVAQYIEDNPARWQMDSLYPLHRSMNKP
jgi:REP element-mobilizing transposase RayT